jgi:hypothetical protein
LANGTIAAYPGCAITCNSGYILSGTTCVASPPPPPSPSCTPASVANGTVAAAPGCAITCNSGYTLSGTTCVASTCSPASVANGAVAAYPGCTITCNAGYTLSGTTCTPSSQPPTGCVAESDPTNNCGIDLPVGTNGEVCTIKCMCETNDLTYPFTCTSGGWVAGQTTI